MTSAAPARTAVPRFLRILDDPWYRLLVDVQDVVSVETTLFWRARGAKQLHLPVTAGSVSSPMGLGSDSKPVQVDLQGVPTYLADSMQFLLEFGCRLADAPCYYLMPSFRGEDADETHLNQFFHSEAEIAGGLDDVMTVAEDYVRHLAAAVAKVLPGDAADHVAGVAGLGPFPRMTFDDVVEALADVPGAIDASNGGWRTLTRVGERALIERFGPFVWVSHWDHLAVPFYQAWEQRETGLKALNADLLFGAGEVIGAGERHYAVDDVRAALHMHHVDPEPYAWYLEIREHAPLRTAGFGMGVERFLMWALRHADIRDLQLVERYHGQVCVP